MHMIFAHHTPEYSNFNASQVCLPPDQIRYFASQDLHSGIWPPKQNDTRSEILYGCHIYIP